MICIDIYNQVVIPFMSYISTNFFNLITAIGIFVGIYKPIFEEQSKFNNSIEMLKFEILNNIENLFTGEIERKIAFEAFNNIKNNYLGKIKNKSQFRDIQYLYDNLFYYDSIRKQFFNFDTAKYRDSLLVDEHHLKILNAFLELLDENTFNSSKEYQDIINNKKLAFDLKSRRMSKWESKISEKIMSIFS